MSLPTQEIGCGTRPAPGLWILAQSMPSSPRRHAAIIYLLQVLHWYTRYFRALIERFCVRKETVPLSRIGGFPRRFSIFICFETDIRLGIPPVHLAKLFDFGLALESLFPSQPPIIFVRPEFILFRSFGTDHSYI